MPLNKEYKPNQTKPNQTPAMRSIVSLLFYMDGFNIKLPMKVDMPSYQNKETKSNHIVSFDLISSSILPECFIYNGIIISVKAKPT